METAVIYLLVAGISALGLCTLVGGIIVAFGMHLQLQSERYIFEQVKSGKWIPNGYHTLAPTLTMNHDVTENAKD